MPAGCHVTFHGFGGLDVDDIGEEEGFAVLAAEVLPDVAVSSATQKRWVNDRGVRGKRARGTYPAYYLVEVCEMCFAVPAAEDFA